MSRSAGQDLIARPPRDPTVPAALALALALVAIPFALHLPIDADRALPLLFLPALFLAARVPAAPLARWEKIALLSTGALLVVSSLFAHNSAAATVGAAAAGLAVGGAAVARRIAPSPRAVRLVLAGLLLGPLVGFVTVLLGWGMPDMSFPTYWSARLFGAHAFSAALAGLALFLLPGLGRPARALAAVATLAAWIALAWSGSRAPALGMAVALAIWFWRSTPLQRRALLIVVPCFGLLALACSRPLGIPYSQLGWWPALERTTEAVEAGSLHGLTSQRTDYWAASWQQFRTSPLIGNGADAYRFLTPKQPGNQPHNTFLQWLLEYGVLGALPLGALLAACLRPLRRPPAPSAAPVPTPDPADLSRWAAATTAGIIAFAFFEGAAYHMVAFMPLAVIAGLAWRATPSSPSLAASAATPAADLTLPPVAARAAVLLAVAPLLVHVWLGLLLLRAPTPEPDSTPARLLRLFPSTTHGLSNWIVRWQTTHPAAAADWLAWAPSVSTEPARFHLQAAQDHLSAKNWVAAERELAAAADKVLLMEKPHVQHLLGEIRALIARSAAATETSAP